MTTCPICKLPYGRSYEEHTGKQEHKDAVWARTRGDDRPLNCCGSTEGHRPSCETIQPFDPELEAAFAPLYEVDP